MKRIPVLLVFVATCLLCLPANSLAQKTISGTITVDTTLDTVGGAIYEVTGSVTVNHGVTLTVDPGVVLKFYLNTGLYIHGTLTAVGGASQDSLIYFTSIRDDNAPAPFGDDTNGDGNATVPTNQDWRMIYFYDDADDASELVHCLVQYGGRSSTGVIVCVDASPTLENCELFAGYYGVRCDGVSNPVLRNTSINAMQDVPVAIEISSDPVFDNLAFESTSDNGFDAIGILGGTLSGSNTLRIRGATLGASPVDNFVYILLGDVTVNALGSLTIDAGVVVKPKTSVDIHVYGELLMNGTADPDSQIVFTSFKDDNHGNPADTNNDGSTTSPESRDWGVIEYLDGATGSVTHGIVRFGGTTSKGMLRCYDSSPGFADLVISDAYYGIEQAGSSASTITDCDLSNTVNTPFLLSVSSDPTFSGNTFTNVGLAALGLIGETIGVDSVLRVRTVAGYDNITYWLNGSLTMSLGAHLRIEPGIVVKVNPTAHYIIIDGSLEADAKVDSLIAFTSQYDDAVGNPADTEGNGTSTTPNHGNWGHIRFGPTSDDARSILDHCILSYGGYYSYNYHGAVWCESSAPTITDCQFLNDRTGVRIDGAAMPTIDNNHFFNNTQVPIALSVVSDPSFAGNTFDQNEYHAVGIISETLAQDAVLEVIRVGGPPQFAEYFPYLHLGTLTIGSGSTLRVEPGVIVKVSSGYPIYVNGGLNMPGTADSTIVYTSIRDDSYGGDSNVDGSSTSPDSNDYYGIQFRSTTIDAVSVLEHCLFRFGGGGNGSIELQSASPTIRNCEFEINRWGLWIQNQSDPVVEDNLFRLTDYVPISKSVLAEPTFSGNVYDNNANDCLGLIGEDIAQDLTLRTWDLAGYTNITRALVGQNLDVNLGATLTIDPGVVIKMGPVSTYPYFRTLITVNGAITALGTAADPIVFTSIRDDEHGNPADTNNDGTLTTPSYSNWQHIYYADVSDDFDNLLQHCLIRYGGYSDYVVRMQTASPSFVDCVFESNNHYSMLIEGDSQPVLTDCSFDLNRRTPIAMSLSSEPVFSGTEFLPGNAYSALGIVGETLAADVTWPRRAMAQTANIPYVLLSNLTVGLSSILRIEPGVVIKPLSGANLTVQRGLIAEGGAHPDSLIVFTSPYDDFYGGDTNNDGLDSTGEQMRWGSVKIQNEAIDDSTRFRNCVFRYASSSNTYGALDVTNANPEVESSIFSFSGNGIHYHGAAGDSTKGQVRNCDFFGHSYNAIRNGGLSYTVAARDCWWGDATGPYDPSDDTAGGGFYNPGGLGDPVTDMVDYSGWRTDGVQNVLLGDVSLNGDIRAYDASLVLQDLALLISLSSRQELIADVNCSGGHSTLDAALILRYVAELDPYFPCAYENIVTMPNRVVADSYPGSEPGSYALTVPTVRLGPGATAALPLELSGSGELLGQEYHLSFDPGRFVLEGVEALAPAAGASLVWNSPEPGRLRVVLASAEFMAVASAVAVTLRGADTLVEPATTDLRVDFARMGEQVIVSQDGAVPAAFALGANYPNPFNPSTTIEYVVPDSPAPLPVSLKVYDLGGRLVRVLVDAEQEPGIRRAEWDGRDESGRRSGSGIYFCHLVVGEHRATHKMVLIK